MNKIFSINYPKKTCSETKKPLVLKPTVFQYNVIGSIDNSNWPLTTSTGKFITVGTNHYMFKGNELSDSVPTIMTFDPINKIFGPVKEINLLTYGGITIIGTDKIYFYGGKLKTNSIMTNRLFAYDPVTEQVTEIGTGGGLARWGGCGCQMGNKLFIFSGTTGSGYASAFTEIDLTNSTFTNLSTTPDARIGGSLIPFNDNLYLTGYTYCDNGTNGIKIWSYSDTTKVWTDTTYSIPTAMEFESKFVILNNELCLFNTSTMNSNINPDIYKFVAGTGFTQIFGKNITPTLVTTDITFDKFFNVHQYGTDIWFHSWLSEMKNNKPTTELIGKLNLTTNEIINEFYPKYVYNGEIKVSKIIVLPEDPPESVSIKFNFIDETIPEFEAFIVKGYTENDGITDNTVTFSFSLPLIIKEASFIKSMQAAYKSIHSDLSDYSDECTTIGG